MPCPMCKKMGKTCPVCAAKAKGKNPRMPAAPKGKRPTKAPKARYTY